LPPAKSIFRGAADGEGISSFFEARMKELTADRGTSADGTPEKSMDVVMRHTDVAIIGGGLAGSLAAAMLGRARIDTILIDPRDIYPPDFRCEKLDGVQVAILKKTGLAEAVLDVTTPDRFTWFARGGRLVEKRPGDQEGIYYAPLVNAVRAQISPQVQFVQAKATEISGWNVREIKTSIGETISARLVVLANGLNINVRDSVNLKRNILSSCHSISIGFDMTPVGRRDFEFPALTYYAERPSDLAAYVTLFPIEGAMRANLFVYRNMDDPWLHEMRVAPKQALLALMPGLKRYVGDFAVEGQVKIRPIDLYATSGHLQPAIVLVGDAFSTSCPAAGTGARKVLNDVERLCNVYVPRWLATPGMGVDKIAAFYSDRVKIACDRFSLDKAVALKAFSTSSDLSWVVRRRIKFVGHAARGTAREIWGRVNSSLQGASIYESEKPMRGPQPVPRSRAN
jgi:2-polyprenyl-6-methoxyphenol hydroxylase-like FAD-dependent oxidoreductase